MAMPPQFKKSKKTPSAKGKKPAGKGNPFAKGGPPQGAPAAGPPPAGGPPAGPIAPAALGSMVGSLKGVGR